MSKHNFDLNNGFAVYRHLLSYVKPYWGAFVFAIIGMVIVAATEPAFAALMKPLLDGTFVEQDPYWVKVIPFLIIGVFVVRGIGSFFVNYCMAWVSRHVIKDLRNEMFEQFLNLPARFYDKNASGQLISKLIFDVEQIANASSRVLTLLIQDSLTLIGLLAWMFYLNWQLSLLFLILGPVMGVLIIFVNKRLRKISKRIQHSMGDVTHVAQETIEAHRVIKIFGGQENEAKKFSHVNEYNRQQNMKVVVTNSISVPVVQLLAAILLGVIVFLATSPEFRDTITVGSFMSLIAAMLLLLPPLKRIMSVNAELQRGIVASQSVFGFIAESKELDKGEEQLANVHGAVRYNDITFRYDDEKGDVLTHVSFAIGVGESVAFVGRSGSGKSTIASLLPRFYNIEQGSITIDGQDIQQIKLRDLRGSIALVSQDIRLFNDTILHNIAYGNSSEVDEQAVIQAAKMAYAWEFIEDLPLGLQTVVGEHGVLLSGGQRQRIAIARAILKDAPILILDEATSALDSESERFIQAALEDLMKNRTTLVIAHRLSTIENVDKIIVLDRGRIVEEGSHKELIAKGKYYTSLYNLQFNLDAN